MGHRIKKGKVMNKVRPVNKRNTAKQQKRIRENAEVLKSLESASVSNAYNSYCPIWVGSRMYSHCPHLVAEKLLKATPADLSLGLISYLKNRSKQDSTQSLEYCG